MMWNPSSVTGLAAAVLCLLSSAPLTARACTAANTPCCVEDGAAFCTGEGIVCVNDNRCQPCGGFNEFACLVDGATVCDDGLVEIDTGRCRPCGGLGDFPCPAGQSAPGCGADLAVNADRCRPCGGQDQIVCLGDDGTAFCTGDRTGPVGPRCRACGGVGEFPCDDIASPCDGSLLPASDDEFRCRPCGTRNRLCCLPESGAPACGSSVQVCVGDVCLRCGTVTPDAGCPGTTVPEEPEEEEPAVGPTAVPEPTPEPVPEPEAVEPIVEDPVAQEPVALEPSMAPAAGPV